MSSQPIARRERSKGKTRRKNIKKAQVTSGGRLFRSHGTEALAASRIFPQILGGLLETLTLAWRNCVLPILEPGRVFMDFAVFNIGVHVSKPGTEATLTLPSEESRASGLLSFGASASWKIMGAILR